MDQLALGKMMMKVNELPALPRITNWVIGLTGDPKSTAQEISRVICQDQVLASKVLKLVNSAYYGLPRRIASVTEAITILGIQTIRTLVIGASVYKTLSSLKGRVAVSPKQIWQHAAACAESCKMLALNYGVSEAEHAFIAGLLHDIGKTILNYYWTENYSSVLEVADIKRCSVIQAERELLNLTHTEIGKIVAEKWRLPSLLVETIGYHHDPLYECRNSSLVQMVHLADVISIMAGYAATGKPEYHLDNVVLKKWNMTEQQLIGMAEKIKEKINFEFL